jgi:hypothetical protein
MAKKSKKQSRAMNGTSQRTEMKSRKKTGRRENRIQAELKLQADRDSRQWIDS